MGKGADPLDGGSPHLWQSLLNRRMLTVLVLGISSGLPLFTLIYFVQAWLAKGGVNVKALGLFGLVQFPYTVKFLWAPFMDRFSLPLGRRKGWIAATQLALCLAIGVMGMLDPARELGLIVLAATVVTFLSASQDIVIDAYRREILSDAEQGLGAAVVVNAYKAAGLIPSALGLALVEFLPWSTVFWIVGACLLPCFAVTLFAAEPKLYGDTPKNLEQAIILPFKEFTQRGGWAKAGWMLAFMLLYKIGDSMATALATKFFLDIGFSTSQIGAAANAVGLWASVAGGLVGGVWMVKLGVNRALWVFGFLQAFAILGFAWLALAGADTVLLAGVMGFESFASLGLGATALVAFLSRSTDMRYTATQYALFSSLAVVPRSLINSSVGFIVDATGWFHFFLICFAAAIPAMLMLPKIAPWREKT